MSITAYNFGGLLSSVLMWVFVLYSVWYFVRTKKHVYVVFGILLGIFLLIMPGLFSFIVGTCIALYDEVIKKKKKGVTAT